MEFPEYEIDSISLLGESILPVKKEGKTLLLDTETGELAFPDPVDDYQMYKGKLYIAANTKVIVCNSKGDLIKEFNKRIGIVHYYGNDTTARTHQN